MTDPANSPEGPNQPTQVPATLFPSPPASPAPFAQSAPESIGPYRILSILGEGGFGVVYLAERREPHIQRVAIKVIKPGMDSRGVLARFEQERQALAVMDHPNVAKVFDAGTTADGRPYFVMEHVKGDPITDYCDRNNLSIKDRLELFIHVCEAVQHAHHKGLIHRDLKPSNVLVSVSEDRSAAAGPGSATPKVIDFGVAKAISHTLTDKTIFTELGQIIGTPEYMSPEQAEMGAVDIDTRTDVYSLGVLLYELLTGVLPFDPKTLRSAGYAEIQRIIREVEPPRPSTRLTGAKEVVEELARKRDTHADSLSRQLRSELEWVPLKAMRKDRTQRYRTPGELADDLRNYMAGRPLIAGPVSQMYRLRKAIRKHRTLVSAGVLIFLVTIAAAAISAWFAARENHQRRLTEAALQQASRERDVANTVVSFLNDDLLSAPDPELDGPNVRVASVLERAATSAERRLAERPSVKARVLAALGQAYISIGQPDRAIPLLKQAAAGYASDPSAKSDLSDVQVRLGEAMWRTASPADAVALLKDRVGVIQGELAPDDPILLTARNELGGALKHAGALDEAESLYKDVLARRIKVLGENNLNTLITRYNLALIPLERGKALAQQGKADEAKAMYNTALEAMRVVQALSVAALGREHPVTLPMSSELASLLNRLGDSAAALPEYESTITSMRRVLGPRHFRTLETTANLARLHQKLGKTEPHPRMAAALYEEALIGYRDENGLTDSGTVTITLRLAETCETLGEQARAAWLLERCFGELKTEGSDPQSLAKVAASFADMYKRVGNEAAAEAWSARAK